MQPRTSSRVDWNLFEYLSLLVSLLPCTVSCVVFFLLGTPS